MKRRSALVFSVFLLIWLVLAFRLVWLQVVRAGHYQAMAQKQHQLRVGIRPERGRILDRQGRALALSMDSVSARKYPYGALAQPLLGFVNRDDQGTEGLELCYDRELRGEIGWKTRQQDAAGRLYPSLDYSAQPAKSGCDLRLTIDIDYQAIADEELRKGAEACGAVSGTVVITDPNTGEILGLACYPAFDPNLPLAGQSGKFLNRAIAAQFEPGSTFKPITVAAGIDAGIIASGDIVDGENGSWQVADRRIGEAEGRQYGRITVTEAIVRSSNICLAKIGFKVGKERLYQYARAFGFGCKTGVNFLGETEGVLTRPDHWSPVNLANISFGQGVSVSVLQLCQAYGAIANRGYLLKPRLVQAIEQETRTVARWDRADTVRRVIAEATGAKVVAMLRRCVEDSLGTGKMARLAGWAVAGKTGTAQKPAAGRKGYDPDKFVASFIGFMPADAPRLLVAVALDEPKKGIYGSAVAAPVFRNIVARIVSLPKGMNHAALAAR
ncbi:MAG: penicillin-binding protein 2 [Candidatus Edwardsbacteria bacterium]|nr:penicillin-binding protein 2 [Candidatus Edwardsbacteria bacterium]